ncbi:hypothetical protein MVEN_01300500 [Mycena venus]|uniref:DUF6534 domain-containing protein n=1 Tax=Mycena venus TaxID=2733690 RepID=A0A8H7CVS3_9AGAR|nr:hypothetical protein MVEN_01300500 [Mycena venus]
MAEPFIKAITGSVQGLAACCDTAIAVALIFYLRSKRERGVISTKKIVDTLILYALGRGILTSITQIIFLVLNVGFTVQTWWQPFHQLVGKLYVNSIFASLNARKALWENGTTEISTTINYVTTSDSTVWSDALRIRLYETLTATQSHFNREFLLHKRTRTGPFDVGVHDRHYQLDVDIVRAVDSVTVLRLIESLWQATVSPLEPQGSSVASRFGESL